MVLAVLPMYPPRSRVGSWLTTHEFLADMVARGHHATAYVTMARGAAYRLDGVVAIPAVRGHSFAVELAAAADVVVTHAGDDGSGRLAARSTGTPHVEMVHSETVDLSGADLTVFNSHWLADAAVDVGPKVVCQPPVGPVDAIPGGNVTIVNSSPAKGIRTFWRVAEAMPDRRFLAVRGCYGQQIEPRAANIEVLPPQSDMAKVYGETRVLLMPSERESFGRTALEAMSAGIPVIAHPTAGLREVLGPRGLFADRDDVDAWVRILRRLDDPSAYAAAQRAAWSRYRSFDRQGSLERFASSLEALVGVRA